MAICDPKSEPVASPASRPGTLSRVLGPAALTSLGIGGIVGTGIFVMTGIAAKELAGPSVILSFLIAGLVSTCAALCYAELSSRVPLAGSAYTYGYFTLGRLFGWLIGWNLIIEYVVAAGSVAQGWSHYFVDLMQTLGVRLSVSKVDLPAIAIVCVITAVLASGIRQSVRLNNAIVFVKLAIIAFVIVAGAAHFRIENWRPFAPFGFGMTMPHGGGHPTGMLAGAALAFYAYLGFEAISVYSDDTRRPQRDTALAITYVMAICAVLYVAVSAVLTGMVPYTQISEQAPISDAFRHVGMPWASGIIALGALMGISSVLLIIIMSLPRILMAMGRDRLLPGTVFTALDPRTQTLRKSTILVGAATIVASLFPLHVLGDVITIATLATFIAVAVAVIVLRTGRGRPTECKFHVPGGVLVPVVAILTSLMLMATIPAVNWLWLGVWIGAGLTLYWYYGRRQSAPAHDWNVEV